MLIATGAFSRPLRTTTTLEHCAGVVKAQPLFDKSPEQHAADFDMLQEKKSFKMFSFNQMVTANLFYVYESMVSAMSHLSSFGQGITRGWLLW